MYVSVKIRKEKCAAYQAFHVLPVEKLPILIHRLRVVRADCPSLCRSGAGEIFHSVSRRGHLSSIVCYLP